MGNFEYDINLMTIRCLHCHKTACTSAEIEHQIWCPLNPKPIRTKIPEPINPGLFDVVEHGLSRRDDPATSRQAAAAVNVNALENEVLYALNEYGPMTSAEIAERCRRSLVSISPRLRPLANKGKVVDTGERRRTASGATAIVWKVR